MRQSRKLDHLKFAMQLDDGPVNSGFADVTIVPNCLPGLCWDTIDVSTKAAGISLANPVIINAITGGAVDVTGINASLAEFSRLTGCAMAVGSQYAAIEDSTVQESYQIIRKINPDGHVLANIGAHATLNQACRAVDMVKACALQIHLNVAQEMIMAEGDRNFVGYLENIARIVANVGVPVIVKEVGCGIAQEQAQLLAKLNIQAIDVGGAGGTNFLAIEAARKGTVLSAEMVSWGIPTAISTIEVASVIPHTIDLIVSGGVRSPLDAIKALALGGRAVGIAGPIVRSLQEQGLKATIHWFQHFIEDIKRYMILSGAGSIAELQQVPIIIKGTSREWCLDRQLDITKYATRKHG